MSARFITVAAAVAVAACAGNKSASADSAALDTAVGVVPAPTALPSPASALPAMLPPAAETILKAAGPIVSPASPKPATPKATTPAPVATTRLPKPDRYSTDTVRGGGLTPVPAPLDVRPSIPHAARPLPLPPADSGRKAPPR